MILRERKSIKHKLRLKVFFILKLCKHQILRKPCSIGLFTFKCLAGMFVFEIPNIFCGIFFLSFLTIRNMRLPFLFHISFFPPTLVHTIFSFFDNSTAFYVECFWIEKESQLVVTHWTAHFSLLKILNIFLHHQHFSLQNDCLATKFEFESDDSIVSIIIYGTSPLLFYSFFTCVTVSFTRKKKMGLLWIFNSFFIEQMEK